MNLDKEIKKAQEKYQELMIKVRKIEVKIQELFSKKYRK